MPRAAKHSASPAKPRGECRLWGRQSWGTRLRPTISSSTGPCDCWSNERRLQGPLSRVTQDNAGTVAEVCRRLDGIPLAIELAAARLKVLSIEQMNARLDDRFRLLTGTGRGIGRQRTLEATVDWSYDLLPEAERQLLRRLSTFAGGWTLEAAEQVCAGDGIDGHAVLDLMTRLVDKSLVIVDADLGRTGQVSMPRDRTSLRSAAPAGIRRG